MRGSALIIVLGMSIDQPKSSGLPKLLSVTPLASSNPLRLVSAQTIFLASLAARLSL
jgi:hypothetical protein